MTLVVINDRHSTANTPDVFNDITIYSDTIGSTPRRWPNSDTLTRVNYKHTVTPIRWLKTTNKLVPASTIHSQTSALTCTDNPCIIVMGAVLHSYVTPWAFQEAGFTPRAEEVVQIDPPTSCPKAGLCHCYCIWENRHHFLICMSLCVMWQGALLIVKSRALGQLMLEHWSL